MGHPILSAFDQEREQLVRISDAVSGERYRGIPQTYHQDCLLYPVNRKGRKVDSFSHIPGEAYCPDGRGESSEHREAKRAWVEFFEDQLSGCAICSRCGRETHLAHPCPAADFHGLAVSTKTSCRGVLWFLPTMNTSASHGLFISVIQGRGY